MYKKKIAVEEGMDDVKQVLQDQGYQVVPPQEQDAEVYVLSGLDENTMGMMEISSNAPVVDARGLTANEVLKEVKNKIRLQY